MDFILFIVNFLALPINCTNKVAGKTNVIHHLLLYLPNRLSCILGC